MVPGYLNQKGAAVKSSSLFVEKRVIKVFEGMSF